jgi:hypothetical protein
MVLPSFGFGETLNFVKDLDDVVHVGARSELPSTDIRAGREPPALGAFLWPAEERLPTVFGLTGPRSRSRGWQRSRSHSRDRAIREDRHTSRSRSRERRVAGRDQDQDLMAHAYPHETRDLLDQHYIEGEMEVLPYLSRT